MEQKLFLLLKYLIPPRNLCIYTEKVSILNTLIKHSGSLSLLESHITAIVDFIFCCKIKWEHAFFFCFFDSALETLTKLKDYFCFRERSKTILLLSHLTFPSQKFCKWTQCHSRILKYRHIFPYVQFSRGLSVIYHHNTKRLRENGVIVFTFLCFKFAVHKMISSRKCV